jgi:hypothetical protein
MDLKGGLSSSWGDESGSVAKTMGKWEDDSLLEEWD